MIEGPQRSEERVVCRLSPPALRRQNLPLDLVAVPEGCVGACAGGAPDPEFWNPNPRIPIHMWSSGRSKPRHLSVTAPTVAPYDSGVSSARPTSPPRSPTAATPGVFRREGSFRAGGGLLSPSRQRSAGSPFERQSSIKSGIGVHSPRSLAPPPRAPHSRIPKWRGNPLHDPSALSVA